MSITINHQTESISATSGSVTVDGNASTATTLATARTIALSGAATGTATSFDGSANITVPVTSLNATNLSGTVPDASISGSYTGMTNLTGSGTVDFATFLGNASDTASAPSYSWTGDTNTGMYRVGTDQLGFATGGVARITVSTSAITCTLPVSASSFSTLGTITTSGTITAATMKATSYQETVGTISTATIGLTTGNVFSDAPSVNRTYVFSSPPASGTAYGFTLKVTPSGTITLTWPASVDWAYGAAPSAPASGETNVYAFYTQDGGTTWYGFLAGAAMA